jgi:dimethylargininase
MFTKAIVKQPGKSIVYGITSVDLGPPDYIKAMDQHCAYVDALRSCGVEVIILDADERFPDSCFVEDTALITSHCAIITNPGAESRKGETEDIEKILSEFYTNIEHITFPGTVEAGDIMMVGNHFYIGISERTNTEGARQIVSFLEKYGHRGTTVEMQNMLHLKTGLSYLENKNLLITGEFLDNHLFNHFDKIEVDTEESYAANCIWVNDNVIVPQGHQRTREKIKNKGYTTIAVDVSEFQKIDGGLSCLSLRF